MKRRRALRALPRLCAFLLLQSCLAGAASSGPSGPASGILFIGNSLTYWNDLPLIVQAVFDTAGGVRHEVGMIAAPDFSLEDHWNEGNARREIERGGWQIVVLQQGPSSLPESRVLLRDYVGRFSERIKAIGARPALYSAWPQRSRQGDFDRAIESYALAAADVGGMLFPVAAAWREAWKRDSTVVLYEPDGLHPTVIASYLAAIVMYGVITDKTPVGLPAQLRLRDGRMLTLPAALAALLQAAAAEAIRAAR
ncbi:MAG: SGNH/GDSL hydrolase family protein [Gemmatimonadaceae bacterium]